MAEQWDGCEARRWRFAGIAKKKCVSLLRAIPSGSTLKRYVSLIQHWFWTYGIFFQFQLSMCVCLPLQGPLFGLVEGKAPNCWGGGVPQSGDSVPNPLGSRDARALWFSLFSAQSPEPEPESEASGPGNGEAGGFWRVLIPDSGARVENGLSLDDERAHAVQASIRLNLLLRRNRRRPKGGPGSDYEK